MQPKRKQRTEAHVLAFPHDLHLLAYTNKATQGNVNVVNIHLFANIKIRHIHQANLTSFIDITSTYMNFLTTNSNYSKTYACAFETCLPSLDLLFLPWVIGSTDESMHPVYIKRVKLYSIKQSHLKRHAYLLITIILDLSKTNKDDRSSYDFYWNKKNYCAPTLTGNPTHGWNSF